MNKIILLGHPTSGLQQVESLLLASGMQSALPSKRDGFLPSAVVDTLCQAHQCPAIDDAMTEDEFSPVQAGPMWQGLALDLVMGNLLQSLWGWADARNIFWLDYWATLDPHATFVMVYDHPSSALQAAAGQLVGRDIDTESAQAKFSGCKQAAKLMYWLKWTTRTISSSSTSRYRDSGAGGV